MLRLSYSIILFEKQIPIWWWNWILPIQERQWSILTWTNTCCRSGYAFPACNTLSRTHIWRSRMMNHNIISYNIISYQVTHFITKEGGNVYICTWNPFPVSHIRKLLAIRLHELKNKRWMYKLSQWWMTYRILVLLFTILVTMTVEIMVPQDRPPLLDTE